MLHYCLFLHSQLSAVCFTSSFLIFHNSTFRITHEQHASFNCQIFFHKLSHLNLEVRMESIVPILRMKEPRQATCLSLIQSFSGKVDQNLVILLLSQWSFPLYYLMGFPNPFKYSFIQFYIHSYYNILSHAQCMIRQCVGRKVGIEILL